MSNAMKAADDLRALANKFRTILEVAAVLEKIGSLENAEREAETRRDAAIKAEGEAALKLQETATDLIQVKRGIDDSKAAAQQIEATARKEAETILATASSDGDQVIAAAISAKSDIEQEIAQKRQFLADVQSTIDEKITELREIDQKLAEAKEKIASFVRS